MKKLSPPAEPTMQQIQKLAAMREKYIRKTGLPVCIKPLCYKPRIYPMKVREVAPKLYEKWNDNHFH